MRWFRSWSGHGPRAKSISASERSASRPIGLIVKPLGRKAWIGGEVGGALANPLTWATHRQVRQPPWCKVSSAGARRVHSKLLLQPVASEGNFRWDKSMQAAVGAGTGGTLGGAVKALEPALDSAQHHAQSHRVRRR